MASSSRYRGSEGGYFCVGSSSRRDFGSRGDEFLSVFLHRMIAYFEGPADLDDAAALEDGDSVAEISDERHGMRDEEVGEAMGTSKVTEEIDNLCPNRDIERTDRLVEDKELGLQGKGSGDIDALPLTSGELMRIA